MYLRPVCRNTDRNSRIVEEGYFHEQLLTQDEVNHLYSLIQRVWMHDMYPELKPGESGHQIESSYTDPDTKVRELIHTEVRAIMARHVERLLENYTILTCGVFIKVPGGSTFGLHHHWTVLDDYRKYVINIWCPLQPTTVESGTLHVLPNTHKIFPEKVSFAYEAGYAPYEEALRSKYSRPLISQPGQAAIFDLSLHHWSSPNTTAEPRIAVHCNCIPAEEKPILLYFDTEHPERFEMYRTTTEFYVRDLHVPAGTTMVRPTDLEFLGYTPNENRTYTQVEYEEVLSNASEVRRKLYSTP